MRHNKVKLNQQCWFERHKSYHVLFVTIKHNETQCKESMRLSHYKHCSYVLIYSIFIDFEHIGCIRKDFRIPRAAEGYLFKGYLLPRHKLEAPYNYIIF